MSDTKLSALGALTGADAATGDLFYVDDISVTTSKSITLAELLTALTKGNVTISGTLGVTGKITATAAGIDVPVSALGTCYSGTYTPTATTVTNVDSVTPGLANYIRIGDNVFVSGQLNWDPTTSGASSEFDLSLPVASNFTLGTEAGGSCVSSTVNESLAILADTVNDRVNVVGVAATTADHSCGYSFMYRIV